MSQKRICFNCSHWEPDFYEENHSEVAGYCSVKENRVTLKYESQTCNNHRFKKGSKHEESEAGDTPL